MDEQRKYQTLCPLCGWGVNVDEDGLCAMCGACAFGDGVDAAAKEIAALREEVAKLQEILRDMCQQCRCTHHHVRVILPRAVAALEGKDDPDRP